MLIVNTIRAGEDSCSLKLEGDTAVYSVSKAYYQPDPSARMCGYNVDAVGTPGVGIADNRSNFFIEGLLLVQ